MKNLLLIVLVFFMHSQASMAQESLFGTYKNGFGERIKLNRDHTFEYIWRFDLSSSWNNGTWKIENEKYLILKVIEVKDTVRNGNEINLVLSSDTISNEISDYENAMNSLPSGGQSRNLPSGKMKIDGHKLFPYSKDDKIHKRKLKSIISGAYRNPWFEKE